MRDIFSSERLCAWLDLTKAQKAKARINDKNKACAARTNEYGNRLENINADKTKFMIVRDNIGQCEHHVVGNIFPELHELSITAKDKSS